MKVISISKRAGQLQVRRYDGGVLQRYVMIVFNMSIIIHSLNNTTELNWTAMKLKHKFLTLNIEH